MPRSTQGDPDVIWMRPERASTAPRVALSRDQLTATAIAVADTQGVAAVSMRQVAARLGCGTMSLYRHVHTKDELFDLMIDAVVGEEMARMAGRTGDWRVDLRALARARRDSVLRHPWLPRIQAGRPCLGPSVVASTEYALSAVADLGLTIDDMIRVNRTIDAFVQGFVQLELAERESRPPHGDVAGEPAWYTRTVAYLRHLSETGDYPLFTRMVDEAQPHADPDADFEWQLDTILDGIAAVIAAPERRSR